LKNYKELEVWQKAVSLAIEVYQATHHFPDAEKFGLTAQIRRAATCLPTLLKAGDEDQLRNTSNSCLLRVAL